MKLNQIEKKKKTQDRDWDFDETECDEGMIGSLSLGSVRGLIARAHEKRRLKLKENANGRTQTNGDFCYNALYGVVRTHPFLLQFSEFEAELRIGHVWSTHVCNSVTR